MPAALRPATNSPPVPVGAAVRQAQVERLCLQLFHQTPDKLDAKLLNAVKSMVEADTVSPKLSPPLFPLPLGGQGRGWQTSYWQRISYARPCATS